MGKVARGGVPRSELVSFWGGRDSVTERVIYPIFPLSYLTGQLSLRESLS